mmetsp:Transcript_28991/g.72851  ORF Transcript_28991/g.72851 Transcript_28991/m.72851 type:complete len:222 (+) Transcript_28991:108-773(+)
MSLGPGPEDVPSGRESDAQEGHPHHHGPQLPRARSLARAQPRGDGEGILGRGILLHARRALQTRGPQHHLRRLQVREQGPRREDRVVEEGRLREQKNPIRPRRRHPPRRPVRPRLVLPRRRSKGRRPLRRARHLPGVRQRHLDLHVAQAHQLPKTPVQVPTGGVCRGKYDRRGRGCEAANSGVRSEGAATEAVGEGIGEGCSWGFGRMRNSVSRSLYFLFC